MVLDIIAWVIVGGLGITLVAMVGKITIGAPNFITSLAVGFIVLALGLPLTLIAFGVIVWALFRVVGGM